jgi:serine/threonine protein kinase/Tol biopolymer transport system component
MALQPGETIHNRYRVESIIAQGGMGSVYLARDLSLDIQVAVKENLGGTESYARQFRREGTVLAGLVHPNLPRVTDHFVSETGSQFLVMDYIAGEDLREMIKRLGSLPEEFVIRVGITICDALTYLHTQHPPILHRDIKPGNIKISPEGEIFLVDFGLVKVMQGSSATTTGAQSLTPGYAPPEQYGGGTDQRSDIYSLGATLYAALTGKIPEDGISRAMGNSRLTPIANHRRDVSSNLAEIVEKALAIEPEKRYQNAAQFQAALLAAMPVSETTLDLAAVSPTVSQERGKTIDNNKQSKRSLRQLLGITIAVILFIVLVASAESIIRNLIAMNPSPPPAHTTELPKTTHDTKSPATVPPNPTITSVALEPEIPTEPGINASAVPTENEPFGRIAFASDSTGVPQIFLLNLADLSITKITNLANGACQPDWSPEGDRLVIVSPCSGESTPHKNSSLFLISADGSGLTPIQTMPGGDYDPDWSPDGSQIIFTTLRDSTAKTLKTFIYAFNLAEDKASRLLKTTPNQQSPRFSPDGTRIVFEMFQTNNPQLFVMNSDGTNPTQLTLPTEGSTRYPNWSPDGTRLTYTLATQPSAILIKNVAGEASDPEKVSGLMPPAKKSSFSPDGKWLLFESGGDLWMIPSSGGDAINLTNSQAKEFDAAWIP